MTVKDILQLVEGKPLDMPILIPASSEFDGVFYSPCVEESGEIGVGEDESTEEDVSEMKLLNKPINEEKVIALVPCGFFDEKDYISELN